MADGIYWYTDPNRIAQKFTATARELNGIVGDMASTALDEATEFMRRAVLTRGVLSGRPTGGPRLKSGDMFNSIDSNLTARSQGGVKGEFGFINDAPYYTIYQEFGTRRTGWGQGIKPMHAFSDAQEIFVNKLSDAFADHGGNIWENF